MLILGRAAGTESPALSMGSVPPERGSRPVSGGTIRALEHDAELTDTFVGDEAVQPDRHDVEQALLAELHLVELDEIVGVLVSPIDELAPLRSEREAEEDIPSTACSRSSP